MLDFILDAGDAGVDQRKLSWSLEANREDGCVLDLANIKQKHPNRGAELWGLEEEGMTLSWDQGGPPALFPSCLGMSSRQLQPVSDILIAAGG